MLHIHRAERADALVAALGALLVAPVGDPFAPELVAVPSRGVERWLAQQLGHVLGAVDGDGVCANVQFPPVSRLLDDTLAGVDAGYATALERWAPERAVWPLLAVLDRCLDQPWLAVLAAHLGHRDATEAVGGRRFAVAAKLARYFAAYGRARPQLLIDWAGGAEPDLPPDLAWQVHLWRLLRAELDTAAPAELLTRACAQLASDPPDGLPGRLSIFGATRISPARVQTLAALAAARDVHLWLHHPSPALWAEVAAAAEAPGPRRATHPVGRHPLLASLARDVRELQQLLAAVPLPSDTWHPASTRPDTLLGRLQDDLAHDRPPASRPLDPDDDSLAVHACHGPARQVEVVREAVLGRLAADPTLEPRDIVIMCPDVEAYAPLIAAAFGLPDEPGGHPASGLRVRLADRALRQTNPLLRLLAQLLEIASGRVTATQLLDLAGTAPVRRRFGFDDDAIERLRSWVADAGARWGLDAAHREPYGLAGLGQGTWRAAVDRVLLGVALEEDAEWLGTALPLDDVDSSDIELAGRLAELIDRVTVAVDMCAGRHPVPEWARRLEDAVLALGAAAEPWAAIQLHRELDELASGSEEVAVELTLPDVVAMLRSRLAGRPSRASFRTGTLTVCTLVPMRSVPHRVVCLLGLDDGAFPRAAIADGDDVLARNPHTGERDVRSEDRQLFLDALGAAAEHLVITYTGADPRTGQPVPPCVPLGELLDTIDAMVAAPGVVPARAHVVVHHPLQPFDARNFTAGGLGGAYPFSFDPAGLAGARAAARERVPVPPLVPQPLAAPTFAEVVALDDLVRFLQHPVRGFLRQRLQLSTFTDDDEPDDALPIVLESLSQWAIGNRVLQQCLAGRAVQTCVQAEHLRGTLPPGPLGRQVLRDIGGKVDALLAACAAEREQPATGLDVAVPLADGRVLAGTVGGVRGDVALNVTYSRLRPQERVAAWVGYLALVAGTGSTRWSTVAVGRGRGGARRAVFAGPELEPEAARQRLGELVALRDAGLREPLPMAIGTSAEYAHRRGRGVGADAAQDEARRQWQLGNFPENAQAEHLLVHGRAVALDELLAAPPNPGEVAWAPDESTRFGVLARRLWAPLLDAEKQR